MLLHLETMMCFFFSRDSFVVLAYVLDQCPTGPAHDAFVGPRLSEGDSCPRFVHLSNWAIQSSCSFGRKTSSEHKASTTMTVGMLFFGSHSPFSSLQTQWVDWYKPSQFCSHVTTSHSQKSHLNHSGVSLGVCVLFFLFSFYKFVRIWQFLLRSVTDTFRWYRKHVEVLLLVFLSRLGTN